MSGAAELATLGAAAVSVKRREEMEAGPHWAVLQRLPVRLSVGVPLPRFRVRDVAGLAVGQTIESAWPVTTDVPLRAGSVQLSWAEFEVVEGKMAVRMTRLA